MPRPFAVVGFTVFFISALLFDCEKETAVIILAIFAAALSVSLSVRKLRQGKVLPVMFASGAVACIIMTLFNICVYEPQIALDGEKCYAEMQLTDGPEFRNGNTYYPVNVTELNGEKVDFKARIVLSAPADADPFDFVHGEFVFYRLGSSEESILLSYKSSGMYLGAYPVNNEYEVAVNSGAEPFAAKILRLRTYIKQAVYRILPNEYGGLATALLLGDRSGISNQTLSGFKKIGVSHIICVSGLHLSIWGFLILKILRRTGLNERIASAITAVFVILIMQITGMTYSVVRSGIMMLVFLLSNILLRRNDSLNSLGFALAAITVFDPFSAGSVSLQLSALSSLGIILCSANIIPSFHKKFEKIKNVHLRSAVRKITESTAVTASAVLFTLPVSVKLGYGFTFAVFPSNLLIVWVAGYAMILCALGGVIGAISLNIFNIPGFFGGMLCKYMIKTASLIAKLDFLSVRVSYEKMMIITAGILAFAAVAVLAAYNGETHKGFAALLCSAVFVFSILFSSHFEREEMRVTAVDIGNGTGVVVTHSGNNILIIGGENDIFTESRICNAVFDTGYGADAVIFTGETDDGGSMLYKVVSETEAGRVYSAIDYPFTKPIPQGRVKVGSLEFHACKTDKGTAVKIYSDDGDALVCTSPNVDVSELSPEFSSADILVSRADIPRNFNEKSTEFTVINAGKIRGELIEAEYSGRGISCASTAEKGNITVRAKNGYFCFERS